MQVKVQFADPDSFASVSFSRIRICSGVFLDPDPYLALMSITKLTGRENLTRYACWLGPGRRNDKENQVKKYKKKNTI